MTWLTPERDECAAPATRLLVVAGATKKIRQVQFFVDGKKVATVKRGAAGLYSATWRPRGLARGKHALRAVVTDRNGAHTRADRTAKICKK